MFFLHCHIPEYKDNLSEAALAALYRQLCEDRYEKILFHDGGIRSTADFIEFMQDASNYVYVVCKSGESPVDWPNGTTPLGLCWLNNFTGKGAMLHFAVLRQGRAHAAAMGRYLTRFFLLSRVQHPMPQGACCHIQRAQGWAAAWADSLPKEEQSFCFDALYGMTPQPFKHALAFAYSMGFKKVGELPAASKLWRNGRARVVNATLTALTRKDLQ